MNWKWERLLNFAGINDEFYANDPVFYCCICAAIYHTNLSCSPRGGLCSSEDVLSSWAWPGLHWRNKNGHKWINHAVRFYTHTRNMNSSSDHLALEEFEKCWLSYFILCLLMTYIGILANLSTVWDVGGDMRKLSYSLFNLSADNEISKSNPLRVIRVARSHKKILAQNWLKKFPQNIFPQYFSRVHWPICFLFFILHIL